MIDSTDSNDFGATLKSKGMYIQVEQLYYSIQPSRNPASKKVILKNLSFQLSPGSLCALLGPSGSGKRYLFVFNQNISPYMLI
ncbi:ATP-binding cassette domain-containing protein [archaeon]|nr:MAG: ATP-binding cassette domain-containing protein [archaeon]